MEESMKNNLKMFSLVAVGVAGLTLFAAKAPEAEAPKAKSAKAAAETVDVWSALPEVVAEVNGKPLTRAEVAKLMLAQTPDGKLPPFITVDMVRQMAPQIVKSIVLDKLVEAEMAKEGYKPSEENARKYLREQLKKAPKNQLDMMNEQFSKQGKTIEQHINEMAKNPAAQQAIAKMQFMEEKILKSIKVTDEEAKAVYAKNADKFQEPAKVTASHILVMAKQDADEATKKAALKKINDIKARLAKDPSAFGAIAKAESDCPSKNNNGSLGEFVREQMVPEFSDAAFKLKPGQISDIVTTQYGYHIIRCDANKPARVIPFEEAKEYLKNQLTIQKAQVAEAQYAEKLEKAANVKYFVTPVAPALPIAPADPAAK